MSKGMAHKCKYTIPIEWKTGYQPTVDNVGGYYYHLSRVTKLMCVCGKIKRIGVDFRKDNDLYKGENY